jgi:hypothetical protein
LYFHQVFATPRRDSSAGCAYTQIAMAKKWELASVETEVAEALRTTGRRSGHAVTKADREAARRSLARFRTPSDILIDKNGNEIELVAASYAVEVLMEFAAPLPARLREQLAPWFIELRRRRQRILAQNRRADRRPLARRNAEPLAGDPEAR